MYIHTYTHNTRHTHTLAYTHQGFPVLAPKITWQFGPVTLCCGGCSVRYRIFRSVPRRYPLDASNVTPVVTIKNIFRYCQGSHGGKNGPWLRTSDIQYVYGLVHAGCCNEISQTKQLVNNWNVLLTALGARNPWPRCQHDHGFREGPSLVHDQGHLVSSHAGRGRGISPEPLCKAHSHSWLHPHDLSTSQRPTSKYRHLWRLGFQYMNWGAWHKHSVHSSIF